MKRSRTFDQDEVPVSKETPSSVVTNGSTPSSPVEEGGGEAAAQFRFVRKKTTEGLDVVTMEEAVPEFFQHREGSGDALLPGEGKMPSKQHGFVRKKTAEGLEVLMMEAGGEPSPRKGKPAPAETTGAASGARPGGTKLVRKKTFEGKDIFELADEDNDGAAKKKSAPSSGAAVRRSRSRDISPDVTLPKGKEDGLQRSRTFDEAEPEEPGSSEPSTSGPGMRGPNQQTQQTQKSPPAAAPRFVRKKTAEGIEVIMMEEDAAPKIKAGGIERSRTFDQVIQDSPETSSDPSSLLSQTVGLSTDPPVSGPVAHKQTPPTRFARKKTFEGKEILQIVDDEDTSADGRDVIAPSKSSPSLHDPRIGPPSPAIQKPVLGGATKGNFMRKKTAEGLEVVMMAEEDADAPGTDSDSTARPGSPAAVAEKPPPNKTKAVSQTQTKLVRKQTFEGKFVFELVDSEEEREKQQKREEKSRSRSSEKEEREKERRLKSDSRYATLSAVL